MTKGASGTQFAIRLTESDAEDLKNRVSLDQAGGRTASAWIKAAALAMLRNGTNRGYWHGFQMGQASGVQRAIDIIEAPGAARSRAEVIRLLTELQFETPTPAHFKMSRDEMIAAQEADHGAHSAVEPPSVLRGDDGVARVEIVNPDGSTKMVDIQDTDRGAGSVSPPNAAEAGYPQSPALPASAPVGLSELLSVYDPRFGRRSWSDEFDRLEQLSATEQRAEMLRLMAGRELPLGFREWRREDRIAWLDENWPLEG